MEYKFGSWRSRAWQRCWIGSGNEPLMLHRFSTFPTLRVFDAHSLFKVLPQSEEGAKSQWERLQPTTRNIRIQHPHRGNSYISVFPPSISTKTDHVKAIMLQFLMNAWFLYVPPILYIIYRKYCTTRRKRLLFCVFLFIIILYPIPSYAPSRRWKVWNLLFRYHRATVILEDAKALPPAKPTIFAATPHAIVPVAQSLLPIGDFSSLLGNFRLATASVLKYVPVFGHIIRLVGSVDANWSDLKRIIVDEKENVLISPGGIGEMYESNSQKEKILLMGRKGMFRLALKAGAQIIPIYIFGNSQTFRLVKGSTKFQVIGRLLRTAILLFYGRFGLPIPFEVPLLYVIGRAVHLPQIGEPSPQDIDSAHAQYVAEIQRIFDTYKNLYGWRDRKLYIM